VELVTFTQHRVSLKKVIDWMAHAGGVSPKEIAMKARLQGGVTIPSPSLFQIAPGEPCFTSSSNRAVKKGSM
jgi:hypothetical protein